MRGAQGHAFLFSGRELLSRRSEGAGGGCRRVFGGSPFPVLGEIVRVLTSEITHLPNADSLLWLTYGSWLQL